MLFLLTTLTDKTEVNNRDAVNNIYVYIYIHIYKSSKKFIKQKNPVSVIMNIGDLNRYISQAYVTIFIKISIQIPLRPLSYRLNELSWSLNLYLNGVIVLPTYCFPHLLHVIKYTTA